VVLCPDGIPLSKLYFFARPIAPICDPALTPTKCSAFISLDPAIVLYVRYPHLIRYRQAVGLSESCP
jgi:hypothetical protein